MRLTILTTLILAAVASLPAATTTYNVDASHSAILWGIQHLGLGNTYGRFNDFSGTVVFSEDDLANSSVELTIQVASIDSASKKRDDHLRNADFFDAGTHPTATFKAKGFKAVEGKENHWLVPGELTLRGTTKPIEAAVHLVGKGPHPMAGNKAAIGFEGELVIDRTQFGVGQGDISKAVGTDVRLIVSIEAIAAE